MNLQEDIPLAPLTTLQVGGAARYFVEATTEAEVREAVDWAGLREYPMFVLGGGSNLVVSDAGWPGLVLKIGMVGIEEHIQQDRVRFSVGAGEDWDRFVAHTVARNCAGVECMSGIPGSVGGTPVQNVGAYGQESGDTICRVLALDVEDMQTREMDAEEPDLPVQSFDAALCRWTLMFLPHLITALTRLRELLVPDGRLAAAVWGSPERVPFASVPMGVIRRVLNLAPPPAGTPGTFSLANEHVLERSFTQAGFSEVAIERQTLTFEYPSIEDFIEERPATSASIRIMLAEASAVQRETIWQMVAQAIAEYQDTAGVLRIPYGNPMCGRQSVRPLKAPNRALDRTAGSHSLAAAGQRERSATY